MKTKFIKMIKNHKIDILINISFIITYLIIILMVTRKGKYILGSTIDFEMQHYIIPDYLRNLFYQTHKLFPNFAFNLGAGQNIYYLSYYGLFNPIILISYLFPKVSMLDYIIVSMALIVLVSTSLFYSYLRKNNYSYLVSFLGAYMFLCSSPLIFQSHRHIMFVNYFPFLIMSFFGVDRYILKNRSLLLIISVSLIIFSSYYFSVSAIFVIFILSIYKFLKHNKIFSFKKLRNYFFNICLKITSSILISAILILPTFYALTNGRSSNGNHLSISRILIPKMYLLYGYYNMGLTIISLISTIYMLQIKEKHNKFLAIVIAIISTCPVFTLLLNGFLYADSKALIPFIPLVLILVCEFLNIVFKKIRKKHKKVLLIGYIIFSSLSICIIANFHDPLILKDTITDDFNKNYTENINKIISNDDLYRINNATVDKSYLNRVASVNEYKTTIYSSTSNNSYNELYKNIFHNPLPYRNKFMLGNSNNLLFQMYMGEKYIITKENYNNIYEKVDVYNDNIIYKNNYVLPIGYATNKIINQDDFKNLSYPSNILNMLGKVVINDKTNTEIFEVSDTNLNYNILTKENLNIVKTKNKYIIDAKDNAKLKIKLDDNIQNKILFISFDLAPDKKQDLSIKINGITNDLTCNSWKYYNQNTNFNYTITNSKDNVLKITFTKGIYNIKNIKFNLIDFSNISNISEKIDKFVIDKTKTKGDNIIGRINVRKEDSYFTLSVPYDKGFKILVDGKKVNYQKVNQGFVGFKISKGNHKIKISYISPYKIISGIISIMGIIICLIICLHERKK